MDLAKDMWETLRTICEAKLLVFMWSETNKQQNLYLHNKSQVSQLRKLLGLATYYWY